MLASPLADCAAHLRWMNASILDTLLWHMVWRFSHDHYINFKLNGSIAGHSTVEGHRGTTVLHIHNPHKGATKHCMVNAILIRANTLFNVYTFEILFIRCKRTKHADLFTRHWNNNCDRANNQLINRLVGSGLIFGHNERMAYLFTTCATNLSSNNLYHIYPDYYVQRNFPHSLRNVDFVQNISCDPK